MLNRLLLFLPVCVLCLPLLVALNLASPRTNAVTLDTTPPVVSQEGVLPDNSTMERLAQEDPLAFLENCIRRYQRDVEGYSLILQKQEFIGGSLQSKELCEIHFREKPHSVFMNWLEGARKAERVLYVAGENDDKLLARPYGALARRLVGDVAARDVDGPDAKQSGRFTLDQFGLKKSTERTLNAWKAAKEQGTLHVEYLGIQKIKDLNDRPCFVLRRTNDQPEYDGVTELTTFVDCENWQQTGSIAKGKNGKLIGEYYFRDVKLNPTFKKDQFQKSALTP